MVNYIKRKRVHEDREITQYEKLIGFYRQNPSIASEDLLNIRLPWYQKYILEDFWFKYRVCLICGRQIGKTYVGAVVSLLYALLYPSVRIGLIAPIYGQQKRWFEDISEIYFNSKFLQDSCIRPPSMGNAGCELRFKHASLIQARPVGDGSHLRGASYQVVIIDEYLNMDADIVQAVIGPFMRIKKAGRDNKYMIMSSATYKHNPLWSEYVYFKYMQTREPERFAVHEYDYRDALSYEKYCELIGREPPYRLDIKSIEDDRTRMPSYVFDAENLRTFVGDIYGFINSTLLEEKCTPKKDGGIPIELRGNDKYQYFAGIDPAYSEEGDNFAIAVIKKVKNIFHVVHVSSSEDWKNRRTQEYPAGKDKTFPEMEKEIRLLLKKFPIVRVAMDAGAAGGGPALSNYLAKPYSDSDGNISLPVLAIEELEDMRKKGKNIVGLEILNMVQPTPDNNTRGGLLLKSLMEEEKLLFPISRRRDFDRDVEIVANEIVALKRELLTVKAEPYGDKLRFSVPTKYRKDRFSALCLALMAAMMYEENKVEEVRRETINPIWV
mgnify:FL=1